MTPYYLRRGEDEESWQLYDNKGIHAQANTIDAFVAQIHTQEQNGTIDRTRIKSMILPASDGTEQERRLTPAEFDDFLRAYQKPTQPANKPSGAQTPINYPYEGGD